MSFDIVMSIYDLRRLITADMKNFYSLLYVNKNQLSFVKDYIRIKSSDLENPDEFILYEYISLHESCDITELIVLYNISDAFKKILISTFNVSISFTFTIASFNNNYEIMKCLLDINEDKCDIQHVIHNKQYNILRYIMDNTDLCNKIKFHKKILIPIILTEDIAAFNICRDCYISHKQYYVDMARRANKKEILRVIKKLKL